MSEQLRLSEQNRIKKKRKGTMDFYECVGLTCDVFFFHIGEIR